MSQPSTPDPAAMDWLTLDDDETLVWAGKPHKSSLIPALIVGIPLSVVLVGLLVIGSAYLYRENTRYVVTTDALYRKSGIISRDVQRIDFGKVQNTSYSQGFFGTRFGYGTVDVSTAGGSGVEMQFQSVPDPRQVQETINKRVKATQGDSTSEGDESKADVLEDILAELRDIRTTLEAREATDGGSTDATEQLTDSTLFEDESDPDSADE